MKYKSVKITVQNVHWIDRIFVGGYNILIWLAINVFFKDDPERMEKEVSGLIKDCYKRLREIYEGGQEKDNSKGKENKSV